MFKNVGEIARVFENAPAEEANMVTNVDIANEIASDVFRIVERYVKKHGDIAISCGGEFVYQDDDAQVDAISSFTEILEALAEDVQTEE